MSPYKAPINQKGSLPRVPPRAPKNFKSAPAAPTVDTVTFLGEMTILLRLGCCFWGPLLGPRSESAHQLSHGALAWDIGQNPHSTAVQELNYVTII